MFKKIISVSLIIATAMVVMASQSLAAMYYINLPNFRGSTPAEATKALRNKGFDAKIVEVPADNYTLVGKVVKQEPAPNMYVFREKPKTYVVTLYVGSNENIVPDTLLKTEAAAIDVLKKAGYVPKVEYYVNESQGLAGKVWKTDPLPYRNHPKGGTVVLQVAKPGQAMPDFIGKHAVGVTQWVGQINGIKPLRLKATVLQDKTTIVPQDDQKVYAQSPSAGAVLVQDSIIKISAYKYVPPPPPPPPKPTPMAIMGSLVGSTEKDATAWLSKVGLKWSLKYTSTPQQNWGRVIAQSVPAGRRTAGPIVLTVGQK